MTHRGVSVVCTVLFLGIILSCTIFFGVSYVLDLDSDNAFFDVNDFDSRFYENDDIRSIVTFCDYTFFKKVNNENLIVGYDDFLFEIERDGYNFIEDFVGNLSFSENELDVITSNLQLRQKVYKDMGIEYVVAVIPNLQSVYSEKMPFFFNGGSERTRLVQLSEHIASNTDIMFVDATSIFKRIKNNYPVYNNTENTINPLGAYFLYKEIFRVLPQPYTEQAVLLENYIDGISLHLTKGRELAVLSGVDSIVMNRTLSIHSKIPYMYETVEEFGNASITHIRREYMDGYLDAPSIMIEYTNEWDKLQLTPYFSNTFSNVVYKRNYNYNSRVIKNNDVTCVIQIVRECELDSFLDSNIALSYNAGINETESEDTTATPLMLAKLDVDSKTLCIAGRAEEGSVLTIQGAGEKNKTMWLYGEQFILGFTLDDGAKENVNILATSAGKEASEPLTVTITNNPDAKSCDVVIGENSRLFSRTLLDRYTENEIYSSIELSSILKKHEDEQKAVQLRNKKDTEFIYLVVPSKINIYSSDVKGYKKSVVTKLTQFTDLFKNNADISVINLTDTMNNNKHLGPLYYQTASEWTELGAYLGYIKLAEHLKTDHPSVGIHKIEDYDIKRIYTDGGDYAVGLGLDPVAFSELVPVLSPRFAPLSRIVKYENKGYYSYESRCADRDLPTAIVLCDNYGEEIVNYIAESFSHLRILSVFQKEISDSILDEVSPDYIIKIFGEDNIDYFAK